MTDEDRLEIIRKMEEFDVAAAMTEDDFEQGLVTMGLYILFGTPWEPVLAKDRKHLLRVPLLRDLPLICKGDDCEVAAKCPIIRKMTHLEKQKLIDTDCRAERAFAIEMLASHLKSLSIQVGDGDFTTVADLVRNFVLRRRMEWKIAIDGTTIQTPNLLHQMTGTVHDKMESHPLKKEIAAIEKQINILSRNLLMSRKDKATVAANFGRSAQDIIKSMFNRDLPQGADALPQSSIPTILGTGEVIEGVILGEEQ